MATLNSSYQYLGRSNVVTSPAGWDFYILLYAKTVGDVSSGKHSVTVKQRLVCDVGSSFYGFSTSGSVSVDGSSAFSWSWAQIPGSPWNTTSLTEGGYTYPRWIDLKEGTVVVNTGYGVAKSVSISSSWVMNATSDVDWLPYAGRYAKLNVSVTLPMIASASAITSVSNVILGNKCGVTWTPQAASFRYKLKFALGGWNYTTGIIHPNTTGAYTYEGYVVPLDVANQITNAKTGEMTATLYTYSDSNATAQVGSAQSAKFIATVPEIEGVAPTLSMALSPVSSLGSPFKTLYIQGRSKVKAELTADTNYGATVATTNILVDGVTYEAPYTSDFLSKAGDYVVKGSVKDSRGYYGTYYKTITVIQYSRPKLLAATGESNVVAARCDENGNVTDSGTYLKIKAKRWYEKVVSNNVQKNFCKIQYRYKAEDVSSYSNWVTILDSTSLNSDEVVTGALLNGALKVDTNYRVQIQVIDDVGEKAEITLDVPSEKVYMDRPAGGKGMGLGGYNTADRQLDLYWKLKARAGLSFLNATGDEIDLTNLITPGGQVSDGWDPNNLSNGLYVVTSARALKDPATNAVLCYNGVLIQMQADVGGSVKIQMVFPTDTLGPAYRLKWYNNGWTAWTKL